MKKSIKYNVIGMAGLLVLTGSQIAVAGRDVNPVPPEIYVEQAKFDQATGELIKPQALGDPFADLTYTAVTPCRLVDTRGGTGAFAGPVVGGTTLAIDTDGLADLSSQGGSSGCGSWENVAGIAVVVTAASPSNTGHFRAFAYGGSLPNASVLNYRPGVNIANTTIVPQNTGVVAYEMSLYVSGTTHVVVDVVGYFDPPSAAAPTTKTVTGSATLADTLNSWTYSPNCGTGWALTGGGCYDDSSITGLWWWGNQPDTANNPATRWACNANNASGTSTIVYAYGICTQVP